MRKLFSAVLAMAVIIFMTGLSTAAAQGKSGGKGGASSGRPATSGMEHAESTANPHGVSHGIENAESKQAAHKGTDKDNDKDKDKDDKTKHKHKKDKHKGKGKS